MPQALASTGRSQPTRRGTSWSVPIRNPPTRHNHCAEVLGLSLSAVTKALLKQFVRTKQLSLGGMERSEIPNAYLRASLAQSEKDIKAGRTRSFKSAEEAIAYITP